MECNPKEMTPADCKPVRRAHLARIISQSVPPETQGMTSQRFDPCTNEQNRGKMFLCLYFLMTDASCVSWSCSTHHKAHLWAGDMYEPQKGPFWV